MDDFVDIYSIEHGKGRCSVVDCHQCVYGEEEAAREHPHCYCHAKIRDDLIGPMKDYFSYPNTEWRSGDWSMEVE